MTTYGTLNGRVYTDTDFNATNYANRVNQLACDIFDHVYNDASILALGTVTVGTGSKSFSISNNLSSGVQDIALGSWVYVRPSGQIGATRTYMQNWMLGVVTAISASSITVNVIIARGTNTYSQYYIAAVGDIITSLTSPYPLANGGTGQTTQATARSALGLPDQLAQAEILYDDFAGQFNYNSTLGLYLGEQFEFGAFGGSGPSAAYAAQFINAPQLLVAGDTSQINYNPDTVPTNRANSWASHPGVIGLLAQSAGAQIYFGPRTESYIAGATFQPGNAPYSNFAFPYTNDVLEFGLMIPVGYGFDANNLGGFSFGADVGSWQSVAMLFCIGGTAGLSSQFTSNFPSFDPSTSNPMNATIVVADTVAATAVSTGAVSLQEGVWYRVRMTATNTIIYKNGTQVVGTISGYTIPSLTSRSSKLRGWFGKAGGGKAAGILLDYVYYRHPVSR